MVNRTSAVHEGHHVAGRARKPSADPRGMVEKLTANPRAGKIVKSGE